MKVRLAVLFIACLLFSPIAIAEEASNVSGTTLDLTVEAKSQAAPDQALIDAGVITSGATPSKAMEANAQKMGVIIKALKAVGIADKDIQTASVNLSPEYNYGNNNGLPPKIVSYQASNNITVTVRNLKTVGSIMDTAVTSGANQVSGPSFSIENMSAAYDTLRKEAVDKAQKRAALYAAAAGLKVKRIISISESSNSFHPPVPMGFQRMATASAATPIAAGELAIETILNVKYELAAQ